MNFTPIGNKVYTVSLKPKNSSNDSHKKSKKSHKDVNANLKLDTDLYLNNNNPKLFRVRYNVSVEVEEMADIDLVYDFDFEADAPVEQSLGGSLTIRSQIPNYVFPYIKSYLEHFLMMSGYGYIPFPNVDFITHPIPEKSQKTYTQ